MSIPPPPATPFMNGDDIGAEQAAHWAGLPAEVAAIVRLLPMHAATALVRLLSEFVSLAPEADASLKIGTSGLIAGRIAAAIERGEITAEQFRLLMDYLKGLR